MPYLDVFRTRSFPDTQTSWAAFLAGQIDVTLLDGLSAKTYIAQRDRATARLGTRRHAWALSCIPTPRSKPMDDARVTRALRLLTDHDEWISAWAQSLFGRGDYGSLFPPVMSAWDFTQDEYAKQPGVQAAQGRRRQGSDFAAERGRLQRRTSRSSSPIIANTGQQGQAETALAAGTVEALEPGRGGRRHQAPGSARHRRRPGKSHVHLRNLRALRRSRRSGDLAQHDLSLRRQPQFHGILRPAARRDDRQAAHDLRRRAAQGGGQGHRRLHARPQPEHHRRGPIFPPRDAAQDPELRDRRRITSPAASSPGSGSATEAPPFDGEPRYAGT